MRFDDIEAYVAPIIRDRLQSEANSGWELDGPADVQTLWKQGRLSCRSSASFWMDVRTYSLTSATVRLRRIATA